MACIFCQKYAFFCCSKPAANYENFFSTEKFSVTGGTIGYSVTAKLGIFVFAGYAPNTDLVKDLIALDSHGYVETDRTQKTSCPGIYAAGDVCQKNLRQVVTAVGDGATAATELEKYAAAMQGKTGIHPEKPIKKEAEVHKESKMVSSPVFLFL